MSTTRHLINRQRRLAAVAATTPPRTAARPTTEGPRAEGSATGGSGATATATAVAVEPEAPETSGIPGGSVTASGPAKAARPSRRLPPSTVLTAVLALLTVLLGGFAALAAAKASSLRDSSATGNTALTDTARTSEVKGAVAQDVNAVFSYDYTDTARTDAAAKRLLTGKAVQQYAGMIAQVRAQAPKQKLVLTTTVTSTGVENISGDRARVLVYADQRNTSTAAGGGGTTYAAAMFAVDAVRQGGTWKIASIDTFG